MNRSRPHQQACGGSANDRETGGLLSACAFCGEYEDRNCKDHVEDGVMVQVAVVSDGEASDVSMHAASDDEDAHYVDSRWRE